MVSSGTRNIAALMNLFFFFLLVAFIALVQYWGIVSVVCFTASQIKVIKLSYSGETLRELPPDPQDLDYRRL